MNKLYIPIIGAVVLAGLIGATAQADQGFNCYSSTVPDGNATCQGNIVEVAGVQPFSCGDTRNHDQVVYCGAVYGYESNWCARIQNTNLREACFRDTE